MIYLRHSIQSPLTRRVRCTRNRMFCCFFSQAEDLRDTKAAYI